MTDNGDAIARSETGEAQPAAERVSRDSVVAAIRELAGLAVSDTARTVLLGLLVLKSKAVKPGDEIAITATGATSVKPELDLYFGVALDTSRPYLNPFGKLAWLRAGYERFGVFTHLYPSRTLRPYVDVVPPTGPVTAVTLPPEALIRAAAILGEKLPLEPSAAFLLRNEQFAPKGSTKELVETPNVRWRGSCAMASFNRKRTDPPSFASYQWLEPDPKTRI